ncbi:hypothetical protein COT48_00975 [Candidatus Woesearchaeota archaeon CG08_land_8_20_14_0_20_47_9]|nr:MAG: hypothetical protein COT48_00975 [Candidatus Woesearchaeota archaeon CG08_land_8_20_14_0_20_47_9]
MGFSLVNGMTANSMNITSFSSLNLDDVVIFFSDANYPQLIYSTLIFFFMIWLIWFMYIELSRRDLFDIPHPVTVHQRVTIGDRFMYFVKYLTFFPVYTFFWFILLVLCIKILSRGMEIQNVMLLGITLISVVRIASYISEKMAEDAAKMLPLALVSTIVLQPSFFNNISSNTFFLDYINNLSDLKAVEISLLALKYLLFTIALEMGLRSFHIIRLAVQKNAAHDEITEKAEMEKERLEETEKELEEKLEFKEKEIEFDKAIKKKGVIR